MASLADVASGGGPTYRDYVLACAEKGVTPMPVAQWIAAGRPSGL